MSRRTIRTRTHSKVRFLSAGVDYLEVRQLLSAVTDISRSQPILMTPFIKLNPMASPNDSSPPSYAFTPAQIAKAYGFDQIQFGSVKGDGTGQTIAIVDAYDDANIQSDLDVFNTAFGLPSITITKVDQNGGTSYPAQDPTGGWEFETSLDVEWAHAMAPGANIILVEANSAYDYDLFTAVGYASAHASVVSMSWGGGESPSDISLDGYFKQKGVVFVASSGDYGAPVSYPSSSANVLSVGGTSLYTSGNGTYQNESGWSGSGGGPSAYIAQPSYQKGVVTQTTTNRANPDVAYNADPATGFAIYDTTPYNGTTYNWTSVGGTSAGAPQWASLVAIADQGRALGHQPLLNATDPQEIQKILYQNVSDFHDIVSGASTGFPQYGAKAGYDYVTGLGSPYADRIAMDLSGQTGIPDVEYLTVTAPSSATAGFPIQVTVTAHTPSSSTVDTAFVGNVTLAAPNDPIAGLPSSYTFTSQDHGVHTFTVYLKTAGANYITATDTTTGALSGKSKRILVSPNNAVSLSMSPLTSPVTAGSYQTVTVSALDVYGNVATSFTGTLQLTTSDPRAYLSPSSYTFKSGDAGTTTFLVDFNTAGTQSLKVSSKTGFNASQTGITVIPATPYGLVASPASSSSITLSWYAASGATKYVIQRSLDGSTWTQIGQTAPDTTSYTDKGLLPGTTYFYRVQAAGGAGSGYSGTAFATTAGVTAPATTTFWSNSFNPTVNSYASGNYEVGMKFYSTVDGSVTGLRFYKQAYMGGYIHVGHLWAADGTLLASATFSSETYSGWQQVNFGSPVALSANTTYIVSFSTGGGPFGITTSYFSNGGTASGTLRSLSNAAAGGNGVYGVGNGTFPTVGAGGMNFWADVVFAASSTQTSVTTVKTNSTGSTSGTATGTTTLGTTTLSTGSSKPNSITSPGVNLIVASKYPYRQTVNQALTLSSSANRF